MVHGDRHNFWRQYNLRKFRYLSATSHTVSLSIFDLQVFFTRSFFIGSILLVLGSIIFFFTREIRFTVCNTYYRAAGDF